MDVSKRLPAALGLVTAQLKGQFGESHKDTGNVQKKQMEKLGLNPAGTDRGVEYSEYRKSQNHQDNSSDRGPYEV